MSSLSLTGKPRANSFEVGIGVVGYGYWGPNLVRNISERGNARLVAISDLSDERRDLAARRYPAANTTRDFRDLVNDPAIDAIVIATPVRSHYEIALSALRAGKHVLVEKPMTETSAQAKHLLEEADRRNLVLMVDHTFIYTPAVQKIREIIVADAIGGIYYYDSIRVNLGLFQRDVNVIWDLAVHDFSILDYAVSDHAVAVSANGAQHVPESPENIGYITVFFQSGMIAHINVNWLAPVKVRKTLIGGSQKMILYDDLEPSEKIKIYDKGVMVRDDPERLQEMRIGYRSGDMWAPQLSTKEALRTETEHFLDCITKGDTPMSDGVAGLRVVEMLEATTSSMRKRGYPVEFSPLRRAS